MKQPKYLHFILPCAFAVAACSSILGIEDVHEGPKPGSDDGGDPGTGGNSGTGGKGGASGSAGSSGSAGTTGGVAGTGGTTGGTAGGAGDGDTGGVAGTGGAGDTTVHGRVVTYFLQPIANVNVSIGAAEAATDANGEFEIPDVAPQYDVQMVLNFTQVNSPNTYAWVYQGLTRRDPTLQVYGGADERSGYASVTLTNLAPLTNRQLVTSIGAPSGSWYYETAANGLYRAMVYWRGNATTIGVAHALVWDMDSSELPTAYQSYDFTSVALSETADADITFDMPDMTIASGSVSGTVTSPTSNERANGVFVRFTSNATIPLVSQYGSGLSDPTTYTYVVPTLPNATISVVATEGNATFGACSCAHKEHLVAHDTNVDLTIPAPSTITAPSNSATGVDRTTPFRWNGTAGAFVVHIEDAELADPYRGIFIVTSQKQLTIPTFPDGFALIPGSEHWVRVETHGDATSVDELAGPDGFADAYSAVECDEPKGPNQNDGSYTISESRYFTMAP